MVRGKFITLEGGEGSGKSTQILKLKADLSQRGIEVLCTREPGGSAGGERIRELLVKGDPDQWDPLTEAVLFLAARRDHVERVVKPALESGKWVISDRYHDSTIVYTGYGQEVDLEKLHQLYHLIIGDFYPEQVFIFDIDPQIGLKRVQDRGGDEVRIEKRGLAYHQKIREGYLQLAKSNINRYTVIDANQSPEDVYTQFWCAFQERLLSE